jgi:4-amino-4-deoxy-L-arabinose transferase-like glycosyltransferase
MQLITLGVAICCAGWIIATRLHTAAEPLERDIVTEVLMGRELAAGARMYVDVIEFKPPGSFVIWQGIHALVGSGPGIVCLVNIVVALISLGGAYWAGSAGPWGRAGGLWAMVFWALICGDLGLEANQPNIEVFMNALMVWAFALWVRSDVARTPWHRYVLIGLLAAMATLQKHHLIIAITAISAAWVCADGWHWQRLRPRVARAVLIFATIAAAWLLMLCYFAADGRLGACLGQIFGYAFYYASTRGGYANAEHGGLLSNIAKGIVSELYPNVLRFTWPLLLAATAAVALSWRSPGRQIAVAMVAWLAGTFFVVALPGTFYPHYYQLYLTILAVAAGWGISAVNGVGARRIVSVTLGLVVGSTLLLHEAPQLRLTPDEWSIKKYGDIFVEDVRCAKIMESVLHADETFFVWGTEPNLYYYAHRRPPSGIMWADRLLFGPLKDVFAKTLLSDLDRTRPPVILTQFGKWPIIEAASGPVLDQDHPFVKWLLHNYELAPKAKFSPWFDVWFRKDSRFATSTRPITGPTSVQAP